MSEKSVFNYNFLLEQASGNARLAEEVLGLFRVQTSLYVQALRNAKSAEDVVYLTHGIRNSAGAVGAEKLAELAWQVEMWRPEPGQARDEIAQIETALVEALRASEDVLAQHKAGDSPASIAS